MNKSRVVVTGLGVIAPNGSNREEFYHAIMNGESGLRKIERLKNQGFMTDIVGEVKLEKKIENISSEDKVLYMTKKAFSEAILDSGLTKEEISSLGNMAGLSIATSNAGFSRIFNYLEDCDDPDTDSSDWLTEIPNFIPTFAEITGVKGEVYTTATACAAGTACAGIALDAIRSGKTDLMVVLGVDIMKNSVGGFHSLQSLSVKGCKPFDVNRDGVSLGEGAVAMILESDVRAKARGAEIYGEILGYGLGNDAYHITSPDPNGEGAYRTMKMALDDSGLGIEDIDYINAHGTATKVNDPMELKAISKLYKYPKDATEVLISSTKSMTGHGLGVAGALELAIVLLAIKRGVVPGTAFLDEYIKEFQEMNLIKKSVKKKIKYALSNSFAFSGHSASIIVGRYE